MSTAWKNLGDMGSKHLLPLMRWIVLHLGRPCSRFFLYFIVGYYFLFTNKGKTNSRNFLEKALGRPVTSLDISKHFFCFASTILDRAYMVSGKTNVLSLDVQGADMVAKKLAENKGCIMLGSHLGSFEILRCLAQQMGDLPLSIVIEAGSSQQFNHYLYAINPQVRKYFIDASDPDSVFKIDHSLKQGNMVGILGDRIINQQRKVTCDFLGKAADFPTGPMLLASLFQVPVVLFFGVYLGGNRYKIIFELFADRVITDRKNREQQIKAYVEQYVKRLEHYTKEYPYNWFNFYDYWKYETH